NRQRIGGDLNLEGEGMLVWHVDEGILHSPTMQNDGTGGAVRGLVLEEADGLVNMVGSNFGDEGDPFPGTASNTLFGSLTNPSSIDNTQRATRIEVSAIGASAPTMSATLRAGNRGPLATAVAPPAIDNDQVAAQIEIAGARIQAGATFVFVLPGAVMEPSGAYDSGDILPVSLEWVDATLIRATVNVYSKTAGLWDLVVTNPDGQSYTLASAVTINHIVATMLRDASISVTDTGVRLRYELLGREANEVVRLPLAGSRRRMARDCRWAGAAKRRKLRIRGYERRAGAHLLLPARVADRRRHAARTSPWLGHGAGTRHGAGTEPSQSVQPEHVHPLLPAGPGNRGVECV
ncbi:MAG: hypothetical protein OEY69_05030, partial [Candidatus Krumholzibacteria bacterium]|nr:hypothetical protein [Candidatus Krumholzibacteria bacterium]